MRLRTFLLAISMAVVGANAQAQAGLGARAAARANRRLEQQQQKQESLPQARRQQLHALELAAEQTHREVGREGVSVATLLGGPVRDGI